jgi:hypothetical protein
MLDRVYFNEEWYEVLKPASSVDSIGAQPKWQVLDRGAALRRRPIYAVVQVRVTDVLLDTRVLVFLALVTHV